MVRNIASLKSQPRAILGAALLLLTVSVTAIALPQSDAPEPRTTATVVETISLAERPLLTSTAHPFLREERVAENDTVAGLLARMDIADRAALEFIRASAATRLMHRQLRPGKVVTAETDSAGKLLRLIFPLNAPDDFVIVTRQDDGHFAARQETIAGESEIVVRNAEINYSLFGATDAAGIPDSIAIRIADIFGGEVDFQREIQKGDRLSVVYEVVRRRGLPVGSGRVLSAEFRHGQRTLHAYYFENSEGSGYYDAKGRSLRKAFLRSPIEFSRVTSRFAGSRHHPVLKEWRAHRGVDYGAAIGTRVRTTSDGTVAFAGKQGGYGNLVVIKHRGNFSTAYAHLNGFANGIKPGARVQQGETIGFVGRTGLVSGSHLHYEFRVAGRQVNPLSVTLPEARPLSASALAAFQQHRQTAVRHLDLANYRLNRATPG